MKKLSVIIILFLITRFVPGQTFDIKEITTVKTGNENDRYTFVYDKSGTYVYSPYDTVTKKYTIYSNKEGAVVIDNANYWYTIFDDAGNYYMISEENINENSHKSHFMKNGKIISTYTEVTGSFKFKDGIIYFAAREEGKSHLYMYNTITGEMKKGKGYEDIKLIFFPPMEGDGEPVGEIGFKKDGTVYYQGEENGQKFVVFGEKEEKHYSDIDWYAFETDKNDVLTYFAKDKGKFYEVRGNSFVVQGTREYKKFDYIFPPLIFDKDNNPIYNGVDSVNEKTSMYHLMSGDKELDVTNEDFTHYLFTQSGKLAYVKTEKDKNDKTKSYIIIDGKKSKSYEFINLYGFTTDEKPLFVTSNDDKSQILMLGDKPISKEYSYITGVQLFPDGKIAYVGNNFEEESKNKTQEFYVFIGEKSFGPYEELGTINFTMEGYVLYKDGVYAYIESKIIDKKNYTSEKIIHGNGWKTGKIEWVNLATIYNGKVIYIATSLTSGKEIKKDALYQDNKKISDDYDVIINYSFDDKTGKLEFIGVKGYTFYSVKVQF